MVFNRTYQTRARRRALQGQQLDIYFPRRGRPSRKLRLERAGQLSLNLQPATAKVEEIPTPRPKPETFEQALELTFPEREAREDELAAEFDRLFPPS